MESSAQLTMLHSNGIFLAACMDNSCGLVSFRGAAFSWKRERGQKCKEALTARMFSKALWWDLDKTEQGLPLCHGLSYDIHWIHVRDHNVLLRNKWVLGMRQAREMVFVQHWKREVFQFLDVWLWFHNIHSKGHSPGQSWCSFLVCAFAPGTGIY